MQGVREGMLTASDIVHCSCREDSDRDFHLKAEVRFRSPQTGLKLSEFKSTTHRLVP
jgi:hypothetical protein